MSSFIICDQTNEDEVGGSCNTHGRWKMHTKFYMENL